MCRLLRSGTGRDIYCVLFFIIVAFFNFKTGSMFSVCSKHILIYIYVYILGRGSTETIFNFFVEFLPKKVYMEENRYSTDVSKGF